MSNNQRVQSTRIALPRRLQRPQRDTPVRGVGQDKPLPTSAPPSLTVASPSKKMTRGVSARHRNYATRRKEKVYIWVDKAEKIELKRIAESAGLSVSQTGRAMIVDGIRQKLRIEREVLATPILEAMIDKKMSQLIHHLSDFFARNLLETSQLRYLFVNNLYHETLRREGAEANSEKKKLVTDTFYALIDRSLKEAVKSIKTWNPDMKELVSTIKRWLTGGKTG